MVSIYPFSYITGLIKSTINFFIQVGVKNYPNIFPVIVSYITSSYASPNISFSILLISIDDILTNNNVETLDDDSTNIFIKNDTDFNTHCMNEETKKNSTDDKQQNKCLLTHTAPQPISYKKINQIKV